MGTVWYMYGIDMGMIRDMHFLSYWYGKVTSKIWCGFAISIVKVARTIVSYEQYGIHLT